MGSDNSLSLAGLYMNRIFTLLCLGCLAASSHAIYGLDATNIIDVSETVTADQNLSNTWDYTFTFTNVAASAPIWWIGVYSDSTVGALGNDQGFGNGAQNFQATGGFLMSGYSFNSAASRYNLPVGGGDIGTNGVATLSFTADTYYIGPTVFWAEVEGQNDTAQGQDGSNVMSYVGNVTPPSGTPEPGLMAMIGLTGLGTAIARRRRAGR